MKKITFLVLLGMLASICYSQKLPYPIIFVHGLNSNSKVWNDMKIHLLNYGLTDGGRIDFCLNYNADNTSSNIDIYPILNADIAVYGIEPIVAGDFYMINFDVNNQGQLYPSETFSPYNDVLSNESSIVKQGVALKRAIEMILNITGREKVVLMGHSMGGLAGREYLQNESNWQSDGLHHVAKLITTGTPHGGYTGLNLQLATFINSSSEAYRDLKKEMDTGLPGVYLYGGIENLTNIGSGFYNNDINCNEVSNDGSSIVGINQKSLFTNVDYAYIIGACTDCFLFQGLYSGDGIVRYENANLSEIYQLPEPKNEFIYTAYAITQIHSDLPEQIFQNMQALDEPNEYWLAYGIEGNKTYKGFITTQPNGGYTYDFDDYTFVLNTSSQLNLNINSSFSGNLNVRLLDSDFIQINDVITITGVQNYDIPISLPAGQYYLEMFAVPTPNSYLTPYTFTLTNNLSVNESLIGGLKVYPNPTTSKIFINSSETFEEFQIFNMLGQRVLFGNLAASNDIDLSLLSTGTFILWLSNDEKIIKSKIVKQ